MLKKCAILGLIVLSLGGIALAWAHYRMQTQQPQVSRQGPPKGSLRSPEYISKYGRWYELTPDEQTRLVLELDTDRRTKAPQQLAQEQQDRLHADIGHLAAGDIIPSEIVTYLYGPNWQQDIARYKEQTEQTQSIQAGAVICVSFGAGLFAMSCLATLGRLIVRAVKHAKTREPDTATSEPETPSVPLQGENLPLPAADNGQASPEAEISNLKSEISNPPEAGPKTRRRAQRPSVAVEPLPAETAWSEASTYPTRCDFDTPGTQLATDESSVAVETLQDQAEDLQRQIADFKTAAENIQQAALERAEPLSDTLKELTEQVSAIRDYAADQQDHMKKLQDGYDWGIIRTFCLRVIRCIDNIESRVTELAEAGEPVEHMEEVRDELLFALESSGVEQFEPELGSEYRGQEKFVEAIKQKQTSGRPDQAGKIAKVIRPGYRYVMDEENFKVVRTAQVMLFGCEHE
jgi:molecular chaperone GrpE (heat shock protein)